MMGLEALQLLLTWHLFHNPIKCRLQSSILLHIVSALNAIKVDIDICCTLWVLKMQLPGNSANLDLCVLLSSHSKTNFMSPMQLSSTDKICYRPEDHTRFHL